MKILVIYNQDADKRPPVEDWRLVRPIRELAKHVDWQIDSRSTLIPDFEKYQTLSDFTDIELEAALDDLCQYDIIFSTYQPNPTAYTLLKVAEQRAGTQYVMDVDDDMFAINPDNPVWTKVNDEHVYYMQCMIRDTRWLVTTTDGLATSLQSRREQPVSNTFVLPNYISCDYQHAPIDNGDTIVIGYFGGSSHYKDVHDSGLLEGLARIMHEHKNVRFKSVGMILDTYLPRGRVTIESGQKGRAWLNTVYPNMNFDIAVAPLLDNIFNRGKSNIKWQESTRMGAAFVCSNIGPYKDTVSDQAAIKVVENTAEAWYAALQPLVVDGSRRQQQVRYARAVLAESWQLEQHWQGYQTMFETIYKTRKENYAVRPTSQAPTIL